MKRLSLLTLMLLCLCLTPATAGAQPPRDWEPVELIGPAADFWFSRNWSSYYWREDFTFLLPQEGTKKTWRIISREPTEIPVGGLLGYIGKAGDTVPGS